MPFWLWPCLQPELLIHLLLLPGRPAVFWLQLTGNVSVEWYKEYTEQVQVATRMEKDWAGNVVAKPVYKTGGNPLSLAPLLHVQPCTSNVEHQP